MIRVFSNSREHAFQVNNDQTWRRLGGELIHRDPSGWLGARFLRVGERPELKRFGFC